MLLIVQVEIDSKSSRATTITLVSTLTTGEVLSAQAGDSFLDVQTTRITTYMFDGSKWDPKEELETDQMALSGSGTPAKTLGEIGQFYIDRSTGDLYEKVSGAWTLKNRLSPKVFNLDTTTPFVQAAPTGTDCNGSRFDTRAKQLYVCIDKKSLQKLVQQLQM